tara:strand:- start:577 stop:984 length:408 start_codon:yes stop_codon:yes gene_type:complete
MYQISWIEENKDHQYYLLDTWEEVKKYKTWLNKNGDYGKNIIKSFTVSMVLEQEDGYVSGPIEFNDDEMAVWFDNLSTLLPKQLRREEINATLLNVASQYMNTEEMQKTFSILGKMLKRTDINETSTTRCKRKMN